MTCNECREQLALAEAPQEVPETVRQHLAGCSACQEFIRETDWLRQQVHQLALEERAPKALREQIQALVRGGRAATQKSHSLWMAAGAAAILLLALAGYGLRRYTSERALSPDRLAHEFIADHLRYLPGSEQFVSGSARDVEKWFQGRVDFPVRVPRVPGAALEDARLCTIAGRKAALLHYRRGPEDTLVSLFVTPASQNSASRNEAGTLLVSSQGLNATLWSERGLVYSLVAALDDASLKQITETVRQQHP